MARILIVDDDEIDRTLEWAILERAGHEVILADEPAVALGEDGLVGIDIVITDLQMPGMHGLELITLLRDVEPRPAIIAVSGTGTEQLEMARALGADTTVAKPVYPEALLAAVSEALALSGGGERAEELGN